MLPFHSCYIYGTWRSNKVGGFKVIVWRKTEGGKPQSQRGAFLWGIFQNYLPISASFGLKRIL